MGPIFEIIKHLGQHLIVHAGNHMLDNLNKKNHLVLNSPYHSPYHSNISFLVDPTGIVTMTEEYKRWKGIK